jgi:hypothetical protein
MMLYIYRRKVSDGARLLEDGLNDAGIPARFTQGGLLRERFRADRDKLICWGDYAEDKTGLNNTPARSKFNEAQTLATAGVPTVEVNLTRPALQQPTRGTLVLQDDGTIMLSPDGGFQTTYNEQAARHTLQQLQEWLARPLPPAVEWLPRRNNHVGGSDLLRPGQADYWSKREDIREEYRLHIFKGKSIRAGIKVPRQMDDNGNAITPHEWVRSFDAGWRIQYDGFKSDKTQREIAAKAVEALGLDFGAVDLGRRADGSLMVLEVNRAPGIEGGSVEAYVGAVRKWIGGE